MFRAYRRYRHDACLDIDIDVIKVQYVGKEYTKLKVWYWHRHSKMHPVPPEVMKILHKDSKRWKEVEI